MDQDLKNSCLFKIKTVVFKQANIIKIILNFPKKVKLNIHKNLKNIEEIV
jgi:hypothetical protein